MTRVDTEPPFSKGLEQYRRSLKKAEKDPLRIQVDKEFFPLREKLQIEKAFSFVLSGIPELDQIGVVCLDFNTPGETGLPEFIGASEKVTKSQSVGTERKQKFTLSFFIHAINPNPDSVEKSLKELGKRLRIKVNSHHTQQIFFSDLSLAGVIAPSATVVLIQEFRQVYNNGEVYDRGLPLPNTSEVTQNLGITFESVKAPAEIEVPLHQQT